MKLFWTIIAIFAFAAAGMVWAQSRAGQGSTVAQQSPPVTLPAPIADAPARYVPQEHVGELEDATRQADADTADEIGEANALKRKGDDEDDAGEVAKDELAQRLIDDLLDEPDEEDAPPIATTVAGATDHEHQEPQRAENPWLSNAAPDELAPAEHSVEEQPDGSILVDGLFTIRGKGTSDSPYEITWDYLMSAAETYQPRLGMKDLPERIAMLDGKHVKIAGFLMFPMATFEAKEALIMLNMWDGCCIGTMPSPYDAIEVQFTRGIPASTRQFANYGTIEGKLVVDPYLISDWLIGLYLLEDATLHVGM